jgi:hypothetical protein
MLSSEMLRISRKLLTLALLVGALFFTLSERNAVVQASTCDEAYGESMYTCTNQLSGKPPLCTGNEAPYNPNCTVSYSYTDCQSNRSAVYDLCVLGGPAGVTPQQPMTPPPHPAPPVGALIYRNCMNGTVPVFLRPAYNSCIAAGESKSNCCSLITPPASGGSSSL